MRPQHFVPFGQWSSLARGATPSSHPIGSTLGVTLHWEGPHMGSFLHAACADRVRGIQKFHREGKGWDDIAYNAVVCPHGVVFEGRGVGVTSAANGDTASNSSHYAVCYLGGEADPFTDKGKAGFHAAVQWLRTEGRAGRQVNGHRDHKATECPGDAIYAWLRSHNFAAEPEDPMVELRIVTHNIWVGQPPARARENLTRLVKNTHMPHVLALQEARRFNGSIKGYDRYAVEEAGNPEADNCVLLIREDVEVFRDRSIDVIGPRWIGPKHDIPHPPRDFPGRSLRVEGERVDVLNVHRTPGGPWSRVADSWRAEHAALMKWADQRDEEAPGRPFAMVGDHNGRASDPRKFGLRDLAKRIEGKLVMRGIDGAIIRGCTGKAVEMDDKYGSDGHHPVVLTLNLGGRK